MLSRLWLVLVMAFVPVTALAQVQTRWDAAATIGLFSGYTPRERSAGLGYQESWFETVQGSVMVGRYLTPHLKVEVDASFTGSGTQFRERLVSLPGYPFPYPVGAEVTTAIRSLGAAATWQFRDNEWVHPFVQAGVSADFDRVTVRSWEQFYYGDIRAGQAPVRVAEERIDGPNTTRVVRGLVAGGAKVYISERAFVRSDARWTFGRDSHNLAFRGGVGIDF